MVLNYITLGQLLFAGLIVISLGGAIVCDLVREARSDYEYDLIIGGEEYNVNVF